MHRNRRDKKNSKRRSRRGINSASRQLNDGPAYAGQQRSMLTLPATPLLLTNTVTTGVLATDIVVQASGITGFNTRFGSTFDEYRILGVDVLLRPVTATTGVSVCWFDEKNVANTPTANEAQERTGLRIPNTNASSATMRVMRWRAKDLVDLQYSPITSTGVQPVAFKVYTDAVTWGAPIVATALWVVEPIYHIEFRGVKST